jgi:hypothetical protein
MKSELRDLLWRIDAGEGVKIDSLDDEDALRGLRGLLGSLNLHRSKTVRSFLLSAGALSHLRPGPPANGTESMQYAGQIHTEARAG